MRDSKSNVGVRRVFGKLMALAKEAGLDWHEASEMTVYEFGSLVQRTINENAAKGRKA